MATPHQKMGEPIAIVTHFMTAIKIGKTGCGGIQLTESSESYMEQSML